ncbi:MAG: beta-ketoacyl synthase N-terminal-like domain-containing protein, partial [Spirochaetota bacterium]
LGELPDTKIHLESYAAQTDEYYLPKTRVGMLADYKFNNIKYRIPPSSASHIDRSQLFALDMAGEALKSAGLEDKLEFGNNIGVILGTTSGEMNSENIIRTRIPYIERPYVKAASKRILRQKSRRVWASRSVNGMSTPRRTQSPDCFQIF